MSAPAHSPAPFGVVETRQGFLLVDSFVDSIAALAGETGDHPREEQHANACLFAAAPDLLRALKALVAKRGKSQDPVKNVMWDAAEAAIRRAETGEGLFL